MSNDPARVSGPKNKNDNRRNEPVTTEPNQSDQKPLKLWLTQTIQINMRTDAYTVCRGVGRIEPETMPRFPVSQAGV